MEQKKTDFLVGLFVILGVIALLFIAEYRAEDL